MWLYGCEIMATFYVVQAAIVTKECIQNKHSHISPLFVTHNYLIKPRS